MPSRWTADQVVGLAPDSASVAAGRKLATPGSWSGDGCTPTAVWGLAKGSGKQPYQAAVDLAGPAYKCSCPSRKIPCKHVLGLLLRWADGAVDEREPPAFVGEWLEARAERTIAGEARAERRATAEADPDARAKRQAKRAATIDRGLQDLQLLLTDLVRHGLASARERPASAWEEQARRLVDAQAPALATRLQALAHTLHAGADGWPVAALSQAANLHLVAHAWRRGDALPADLRDDLRAHLGWSRTAEEIRAAAPALDGPWAVIGAVTTDDGRLRSRRTWLQRTVDGRAALLLDFAAGGAPLSAGRVVGEILDGPLHPQPGRGGLRVFPGDRELESAGSWQGPGAAATIDSGLRAWGEAVARDPLIARMPLAIAGVVPTRTGDRWWVRDASGAALPLLGPEPWDLLALSGGEPVAVTGEWDGTGLLVLAAHHQGRVWTIGAGVAGIAA